MPCSWDEGEVVVVCVIATNDLIHPTDRPTDHTPHAHAPIVHLLLLEEHAQGQPPSPSSALPVLAASLLLLPNANAAPALPRAVLSLLALLCDPARLRVSRQSTSGPSFWGAPNPEIHADQTNKHKHEHEHAGRPRLCAAPGAAGPPAPRPARGGALVPGRRPGRATTVSESELAARVVERSDRRWLSSDSTTRSRSSPAPGPSPAWPTR